ncbi:MAG: co-chaperone GroES family protein [Calditrichia bacterium]
MKRKKLIVAGDRILVKPDKAEERTKVGLYLPQTVKAKDEVIGGRVVLVGPGIPLTDPNAISEEPWKRSQNEPKYLPVQAKPGDYILFLQKAGIEIKYEHEDYVIIPQSAVLLIVREEELDDIPTPLHPEDEDTEDNGDDLPFF